MNEGLCRGLLLSEEEKRYTGQPMPEVRDEDFELLEAAASLPDALYGSRLYSNTAIYALATQRELYEAKIAELEAKLNLFESSSVEDRKCGFAIRPLRRDTKGVVATVFALVFAICFLMALNLRQRDDDQPSDMPRAPTAAQGRQYVHSTPPRSSGASQLASVTPPARDTEPPPMMEPQDAKAHLANTGKVETVLDQGRLTQSLAQQPSTASVPQEARQPEQVAFLDAASESAAVERAQAQQDDMRHSEPFRLSDPAPDAVRRFRAIDALHALRMR